MTFSPSFFRGVGLNHQPDKRLITCYTQWLPRFVDDEPPRRFVPITKMQLWITFGEILFFRPSHSHFRTWGTPIINIHQSSTWCFFFPLFSSCFHHVSSFPVWKAPQKNPWVAPLGDGRYEASGCWRARALNRMTSSARPCRGLGVVYDFNK